MKTIVPVTLTDDERRVVSGSNKLATRKEITAWVLGLIDSALGGVKVPTAHGTVRLFDPAPTGEKVAEIGVYALYRADKFIDHFKNEDEARAWIAEGSK